MKNQRSLRNALVEPQEQLRYAAYFFAVIAGIMSISVVVAFWLMASTLQTVSQLYEIPADQLIALAKGPTAAAFFVGALGIASTIGALLVGVNLSHRIFGPIVPIRHLITSLKAGDYSARGALRKNDEFQVVMTELNELAESLQTRHGRNS